LRYAGHLFAQETTLQPRAEWELSTEAWLFVRLAAGDASWVDDRSSLLLRANEVFVVPPNRRGTLRASRLTVVTVVYFRFQPELLAGFLTVQERSQVERAADARGPSRIYGATHELAQEFKSLCEARSDLGHPVNRARLLQLALATLLQSRPAAPRPDGLFLPSSKRAEILLRKVSEAELLEHSAQDLATRCGCSVRHMNKLLRDMLGVSLRAKQREIRLNKAQQLLAETNLQVAQVARACGFGEQTSFSVEFKRRFGVTPTEWREAERVAMGNGHANGGPPPAS
jgi:AraC-like DNA-binding protein